jgi:hypothetical protein
MKVNIGRQAAYWSAKEPDDREKAEDIGRELSLTKRPVVIQTADAEPLDHPAVTMFDGLSDDDTPNSSYFFNLIEFCRTTAEVLTEPKIEFYVIQVDNRASRDFLNALTLVLAACDDIHIILHDSDTLLNKIDHHRYGYSYLGTEALLELMQGYALPEDNSESEPTPQEHEEALEMDADMEDS